MAVPKRKTSKTRKANRRSHHKLPVPAMHFDEKLGEYVQNHHVSPSGYYKGNKVK